MSRVAAMLDFVAGLEDTVEGAREVVPGSSFAADDHLCPSHPTSQSVHHLLMSAHGSLAALSRALDYRRSNERMDMTLDLYGVYDLVRNALESGSWALWIAAPYASRRRVRRSLILLEDEHRKHVSARAALGLPDADVTRMKQAQSSRLAAYIEHSGVRPWGRGKDGSKGVRSDHPVSSTKVLTAAGDYAPEQLDPSYLAAWQITSGLAHGRQWAFHLVSEWRDVNETTREMVVTPSYQSLQRMLVPACSLLDTALGRHLSLARDADPGPMRPLPLRSEWLLPHSPSD